VLDDYEVLDVEVLDLGETMDGLSKWEPIQEVVAKLRSAGTRNRSPHTSQRFLQLQKLLKPYRDQDLAEDGATLAEALRDLRRKYPSVEPLSAAEWFLDLLQLDIDRKAAQSLRRLYLEKLQVELALVPDLVAAIYPDQERLGPLVSQREKIAAQLEELLGRDRALDKLMETFLLTGEDPLDFRPGGARDEVDEKLWVFESFLIELREFMLDDQDVAALDECKVKIFMKAPRDMDGVWTHRYLITVFERGNPDHFVDTGSIKAGGIGPLDWNFGPSQKEDLTWRWSNAAGGPQPDDAKLEIGSCFAPLTLAWTFGNPSKDDPLEWRIEVPVTGGDDPTAMFILMFDRELPARPPRPEFE